MGSLFFKKININYKYIKIKLFKPNEIKRDKEIKRKSFTVQWKNIKRIISLLQ